MIDDLPTEFDTIVYGTGIPESIIAGAASRVGKSVLHLDCNSYYGGLWTSFSFDNLLKWIEDMSKPQESILELVHNPAVLKEEEMSIPLFNKLPFINNIEVYCDKNHVHGNSTPDSKGDNQVSIEVEKSEEDESTALQDIVTTLLLQNKRFNIDLSPKVLYSRGPLVQLLISANATRYAEFKSFTRVLSLYKDSIEQVPVSRSDVFSTKTISIVEKRKLMKFLTFCVDFEKNVNEYEVFSDKPFALFLDSKSLPENIQHFLIYSIAMVEKDTATLKALQSIQKFLRSIGIYGNSPFIWPFYGNGELSQGFCRLSAVFGGVYSLNCSVDYLIINPNQEITGIIVQGKRINCKMFVTDPSYISTNYIFQDDVSSLPCVSRAIFITDSTLHVSSKEELTFFRIAPFNNLSSSVSVLEVGPSCMVCPKDYYLVYMTTSSSGPTAKDDLQGVAEKLFQINNEDSNKPRVLWSVYFNQIDSSKATLRDQLPKGLIVTPTPNSDHAFGDVIEDSRSLFVKMYPDDEFLPRAPEPDELVLETVEVEAPSTNNSIEEDASGDTGSQEISLDEVQAKEEIYDLETNSLEQSSGDHSKQD